MNDLAVEDSETAKYRHLTTEHCRGNGVDIGSGGDPVVPWAINFDLPNDEFDRYHSGHPPRKPIQYGGDAKNLPFKDGTLDFVYSSHLLEDFFDWDPVLREWMRVLKPGGKLVILVPDKKLWNDAIARGQPPNCAHTHESYPGEISKYVGRLGRMRVIRDSLTECFPNDYSILFVGVKL